MVNKSEPLDTKNYSYNKTQLLIVSDVRPLRIHLGESSYLLTEKTGKNYNSNFKPALTPPQMIKLGVFGGSYFTANPTINHPDIPLKWFKGVILSDQPRAELNMFKVICGMSCDWWTERNLIDPQDPQGWFHWYCRYYLGRRSADDLRQIVRWYKIRRHLAQVVKNCAVGDLNCRPKQRQTLLHWAYDPRV